MDIFILFLIRSSSWKIIEQFFWRLQLFRTPWARLRREAGAVARWPETWGDSTPDFGWSYYGWENSRLPRTLRQPDGASLYRIDAFICRNLLSNNLVLESLDNIAPLNFLNLQWSIKINEVLNAHVASTDSDLDLVAFFNFDINSLLAKLINTWWLPQEHDFDFVSLRIVIDEPGKMLINLVYIVSNCDDLWAFHELFLRNNELLDFFNGP